jgi:hypothetical protein
MGTRHLIAVMKDKEYKIAQYGQWDGCPSGQGIDILNFIKTDGMIERLENALTKVRFFDKDGDKDFLESYDKNAPTWSSDPDNRTVEQKRWFELYMSRNLGSEILKNVANSTDDEIILKNSINFAKDSLVCEWAYVIDLDKKTFEVFEGFNETSLDESERFYCDNYNDDGYRPVKLTKVYKLNDLPTNLNEIE